MVKTKSHTCTGDHEAERGKRRQQVAAESLCRTCSCPPWEEQYKATCISWHVVCHHKACLQRVAELKALN
eukprot:10302382-Karenia_brevis.AAC.1